VDLANDFPRERSWLILLLTSRELGFVTIVEKQVTLAVFLGGTLKRG
jgi:hypothetical protein